MEAQFHQPWNLWRWRVDRAGMKFCFQPCRNDMSMKLQRNLHNKYATMMQS
jgi:hypothetical protein